VSKIAAEDDLALGDFLKPWLVDAQLSESVVAPGVLAQEDRVKKVGGIDDAARYLGEVLRVGKHPFGGVTAMEALRAVQGESGLRGAGA